MSSTSSRSSDDTDAFGSERHVETKVVNPYASSNATKKASTVPSQQSSRPQSEQVRQQKPSKASAQQKPSKKEEVDKRLAMLAALQKKEEPKPKKLSRVQTMPTTHETSFQETSFHAIEEVDEDQDDMNNYFEAAFVQATCSKAKIGSYANGSSDFLSRPNRASGQIGSLGNEFTVIDDGQNQLSQTQRPKQIRKANAKNLSSSVMVAPKGRGDLSKSMDFGAPAGGLSSMALMNDSKTASDFLPIKFDRKAMKENRIKGIKGCQLCDQEFTSFMGKNPIRHCKRCARSVCGVCSQSKRQLSKVEVKAQRICDFCDTQMDNEVLQQQFKECLSAQSDKIEGLNQLIVKLDEEKDKRADDFKKQKSINQDDLKLKYAEREQLQRESGVSQEEITGIKDETARLRDEVRNFEELMEQLELERATLNAKRQKLEFENKTLGDTKKSYKRSVNQLIKENTLAEQNAQKAQ